MPDWCATEGSHNSHTYTYVDTHWTGNEICCQHHFQRAGPAGQSGPTVTPTELRCVCVIAMSCFQLETSAQETTAKQGHALLTPILYQVITDTHTHSCLFSFRKSQALVHDLTHSFCATRHHMPTAVSHFQESCDNEICYWSLEGTLLGSEVRFIVRTALLGMVEISVLLKDSWVQQMITRGRESRCYS